jgi:hypothetical protein
MLFTTQEHTRLEKDRLGTIPWKKWGPYLSERQWGTVREDYSDTGNAWNYFTHDQARSRAYRPGVAILGPQKCRSITRTTVGGQRTDRR